MGENSPPTQEKMAQIEKLFKIARVFPLKFFSPPQKILEKFYLYPSEREIFYDSKMSKIIAMKIIYFVIQKKEKSSFFN